MIFFCDNCNISVHKRCYGIKPDIADDEKWLCTLCLAFKEEDLFLRVCCSLCGLPGGAMRPTNLDKEHLVEYYDQLRAQANEVYANNAQFELISKANPHLCLDDVLQLEGELYREAVMKDFDPDNRVSYKLLLRKAELLKKREGALKTKFAWVHVNCGMFTTKTEERAGYEVTDDLVFDFDCFDF